MTAERAALLARIAAIVGDDVAGLFDDQPDDELRLSLVKLEAAQRLMRRVGPLAPKSWRPVEDEADPEPERR